MLPARVLVCLAAQLQTERGFFADRQLLFFLGDTILEASENAHRKGSDNLIHKYIFRDKPVVIDVNSGAVHMVDPVIYDALDFYRDKTCDKTAMEAALVPKYGAEALAEACSDIEELIAADMLFSDDEVSTEIFETKQPVVKAMCLHVAHDCNMNCAYCFGDKGAFEGVRCLLTPEMGKKALDFLMQNSGNRRNL